MRWALLGALDRAVDRGARRASSGQNPEPQLLEVKEIIVHPDYRTHLRYHDIALLRLAR